LSAKVLFSLPYQSQSQETKTNHPGPYAPAILRFQISFPALFPSAPPLITFSSDIFHPLLTPLTTYTYTTNVSDTDTVSASDQERLPPGGFSLRHGFPQWFNQSRQGSAASATPRSNSPITVFGVLDYIRSSFNDEDSLSSIPLEAAANPGAYHAWHTQRARNLQSSRAVSPQSSPPSKRSSGLENISGSLNVEPSSSPAGRGRRLRPGEWNWDGVWEERVKRGVQSSLAEPTLFGLAGAGDDIIRFSDIDANALERIRTELLARQ
jgi:hypothetical protein